MIYGTLRFTFAETCFPSVTMGFAFEIFSLEWGVTGKIGPLPQYGSILEIL